MKKNKFSVIVLSFIIVVIAFIFFGCKNSKNINKVLEEIKVTYKYPNTAINDFDQKNVVFSDYDTNKYKIKINDCELLETSVKINFSISNNKKEISNNRVVVISGFSASTDVMFNLNNLSVTYSNISNSLINDFKFEELTFSKYNSQKFKVLLKSKKIEKDTVTIIVVLQDKQNGSYSQEKEFRLSGFITEKKLINELNDEIKKIKISYPQISETKLSEFSSEKIEVLDFDKSKFSFEIKKTLVINNTVKVQICLKNKTYPNLKISSEIKEFTLSGFKSISTKELLELNLQQITVTPNKAIHTLKIDEVLTDNFIFNNYDTTRLEVIDKKIIKDTSTIKLSFRLKDKNSDEKSNTRELVFTKFFDYYKENIDKDIDNIHITNPSQIILGITSLNDFSVEFIPDSNYEVVFQKFTSGLFHGKLTYKIKLKDTSLESKEKNYIAKSNTLSNELDEGIYNGVKATNFSHLLKHFNLKSFMFSSDVVNNVFTTEMEYNGKKIKIDVDSYNDVEQQIKLLVTLLQDDMFSEELTISGLLGISADVNSNLAINDSLLQLSFKDENYLIDNFLHLSFFTSTDPQHREHLYRLLNFSSNVTLNNNESVSLADSSYKNYLTSVKIVNENLAEVLFNYEIRKELKKLENGSIEKISEKILASRVRKDKLQYLTNKKILELLTPKVELKESTYYNYPSFYKSRHEVDRSLINNYTNFFDISEGFEKKYFNSKFLLVIDINKIGANDIEGKLFMEYGIRMEDAQGRVIISPQFIQKTFSNFYKVNKDLLLKFSLVQGANSVISSNQKKAFQNLIKLYKEQNTTELRFFSFQELRGDSNLRTAQLNFVDANNHYLPIITPFYDLKNKKKGHLEFDGEDVVYDDQKGVNVDVNLNKHFNPTLIEIKPVDKDAISIRSVGNSYDIRINYEISFSLKYASGTDDDSTTKIVINRSILHFVSGSLFS